MRTSESSAMSMRTALLAIVPGVTPERKAVVRLPCPGQKRWKDLVCGLVCSAVLHGVVLGWDRLFPVERKTRVAVVAEEHVLLMEMPPLEAEEPEEVVELAEMASEVVLAPPSLVDLPKVVPIDAFTQPLSPPPPPGFQPGQKLAVIPVGRPGAGFGEGIGRLFDLDSLDQRPLLRSRIPPDYPLDLRRDNVAGEVVVEFIVTHEGSVAGAEVVSSTHQAFEGPALRSVSQWKFKPGRKGGRAVNTRVKQVINFNMEETG